MDIKFWFDKLITSSADPKKTSLAVKGFITLAGAFVVQSVSAACAFGLFCIGITNETVNAFAGIAETMVFAAMLLVGGAAAFAGLARKIRVGQWSAHR
jgi:hypothetical protein